jgi:hypothetical protein
MTVTNTIPTTYKTPTVKPNDRVRALRVAGAEKYEGRLGTVTLVPSGPSIRVKFDAIDTYQHCTELWVRSWEKVLRQPKVEPGQWVKVLASTYDEGGRAGGQGPYYDTSLVGKIFKVGNVFSGDISVVLTGEDQYAACGHYVKEWEIASEPKKLNPSVEKGDYVRVLKTTYNHGGQAQKQIVGTVQKVLVGVYAVFGDIMVENPFQASSSVWKNEFVSEWELAEGPVEVGLDDGKPKPSKPIEREAHLNQYAHEMTLTKTFDDGSYTTGVDAKGRAFSIPSGWFPPKPKPKPLPIGTIFKKMYNDSVMFVKVGFDKYVGLTEWNAGNIYEVKNFGCATEEEMRKHYTVTPPNGKV